MTSSAPLIKGATHHPPDKPSNPPPDKPSNPSPDKPSNPPLIRSPHSPTDKDALQSPPDKGGKGGLNILIILNSVFYVNILFIILNS